MTTSGFVLSALLVSACLWILFGLPSNSEKKSDTESKIEKEPSIIINGTSLTSAQAMSVRNAISSYISVLSTDGLGDDENGRAITAGYIARLNEVQKLILCEGR